MVDQDSPEIIKKHKRHIMNSLRTNHNLILDRIALLKGGNRSRIMTVNIFCDFMSATAPLLKNPLFPSI